MTIGGSIALIVIGAILAFAVEYTLAGISITMIGVILMIGGLIGLALGMVAHQRAGVATRTVTREPVARQRVVEERPVAERRVVEDRVVEDRVVDDREIL